MASAHLSASRSYSNFTASSSGDASKDTASQSHPIRAGFAERSPRMIRECLTKPSELTAAIVRLER